MTEFQELKPKIWQQLYSLYSIHKTHTTHDELVTILAQALESAGFTPPFSRDIATTFIASFDELAPDNVSSDDTASSSSPHYINVHSIDTSAYLSTLDIRYLKEVAARETDEEALRLLIAFAIFARANHHPSNWIKYDRATIFFLATLAKKKVAAQERLTKHLHECYNLDMQVVGSNTPIPCFKLGWMADQPDPFADDTPNPLVWVGTYSPETIQSLVAGTFKITVTSDNT